MDQFSSQSTSTHRCVRGSNLMCSSHKDGVKIDTSFDEQWHQVGENASKFKHTLGSIVPRYVPITTPSWHKVTNEQKNLIWLDVNVNVRLYVISVIY